MTTRLRPRVVRSLVAALLVVATFEGCSSSNDSTTAVPASISIAAPATTLPCDETLVVSLATNLDLRPPSNCATSACGSVRVSLLETQDGTALAVARASTSDVQLDLSSFVDAAPGQPSLSQIHFVKVEVFNDSLAPYPAPGGGNLQAILPLTLTPPTRCTEAGAGGAGGDAGTTDAIGSAGAGGEAGTTDAIGSAGAGGEAGTAIGSAGAGGEAGTGTLDSAGAGGQAGANNRLDAAGAGGMDAAGAGGAAFGAGSSAI